MIILLAAGCTIYFFPVGGKVSDDSATEEASKTAAPQTVDTGDRVGEVAPPIAAKPLRPLTLLDRYVRSNNLLDLITQLRAAADSGDAEAARLIAKALDECYLFSIPQARPDAAHFSRIFDEPERSIALAHLRIQDPRCGDLIASGQVTAPEVRRTDQRAKDLGDLAGQAMRLETAQSLDPDASKGMSAANVELARKIALSRDPEAISLLAHSVAESNTDHYAWQLVACDLGLDCGADGYVMRKLCLWLQHCLAGDYREYVRRRQFPPDQHIALIAREQEILRAINSGNVSSIIP